MMKPTKLLHRTRCVPLLAASALVGCQGPARPVSNGEGMLQLASADGAINQTTVISADRDRDAAAYDASSDDLTASDWAALEKAGPRPVWEAIEERRRSTPRASPRKRRPPTAWPAAGPKDALVLRDPNAKPTTAPATQPTALAPSTQPAVAPSAVVELDESTLPVKVTELPDGRIRMIWVLRNFGGSNVKSSRDPSTSRRSVELSVPDLMPLVAAITPHLGVGGAVSALPKENTLVITCDKPARPSLIDLLARLDAAPRQVEITAKIFEVSNDFDYQQGSEFLLSRLATDGGQQFASTFSAKRFLDAAASSLSAAAPVQGSVLRLLQTFSDAGLAVDVSFQLLAEAGMIRVVSAPRITVAVGQTGYMLAGQELPIQSANIVNNALQTLTSYKPVGVQLYVTPQASDEECIKLHTIAIVSAVSGFAPLPSMEGGRAAPVLLNPILDAREAETSVTVRDGDTLVISGLRMVRMAVRENKIPGLGDIPVIGPLFKNHRDQQQQTDLYFFLTPTLIQHAKTDVNTPPAPVHAPHPAG